MVLGPMICSCMALGKLLSLSEPQDTHLLEKRITCDCLQDGHGKATASLERVLGK